MTGEVLGTITKNSNGNIDVKKAGSGYIQVLKSDVGTPDFFVTNYPNPVVTSTNIKFGIPEDGNVTIRIYNEIGSEIGTVVNGFYKAGEYSESFNVASYTSGTYLLKIFAGNNSAVQTMTIIK